MHPIPVLPVWDLLLYLCCCQVKQTSSMGSCLSLPPEHLVNSLSTLLLVEFWLLLEFRLLLTECCWGIWLLQQLSVVSAALVSLQLLLWHLFMLSYSWNVSTLLHPG